VAHSRVPSPHCADAFSMILGRGHAIPTPLCLSRRCPLPRVHTVPPAPAISVAAPIFGAPLRDPFTDSCASPVEGRIEATSENAIKKTLMLGTAAMKVARAMTTSEARSGASGWHDTAQHVARDRAPGGAPPTRIGLDTGSAFRKMFTKPDHAHSANRSQESSSKFD
jgi:hypothetical protein